MKILDVCCGSKMFWYEKHEPHTTYMDIRKAVYTVIDRENERKIKIDPDIQVVIHKYGTTYRTDTYSFVGHTHFFNYFGYKFWSWKLFCGLFPDCL